MMTTTQKLIQPKLGLLKLAEKPNVLFVRLAFSAWLTTFGGLLSGGTLEALTCQPAQM